MNSYIPTETQNSQKPSFRIFGGNRQEKVIQNLEQECYKLKMKNHQLKNTIAELHYCLMNKKEEREGLMKLGESEPTLREDILTDLKMVEAEIATIEEEKDLTQRLRAINQESLAAAERELKIMRGVLPSPKAIENMKRVAGERDTKFKVWSEEFDIAFGTIGTHTSSRAVKGPIHTDAYSREVMKMWERADERKGIVVPSNIETASEAMKPTSL